MNPKVKVLHMITGLHTGGAEMMVYQTAIRLDPGQYETVVVSLESGGKLAGRLREHGIKVYELGFGKGPLSVFRLWRILYVLLKEQPQIVHSYMFHADLMARIIGKITAVPVIISSIRNEDIGGRMRERLLGWTDWMADCVTSVCRIAGERQAAQGAVSQRKLTVVYNGVDLTRFEPPAGGEDQAGLRRELGIPEDHFLFLTVGRMDKQKGYLELLDALRHVVDDRPATSLLILGDGYQRAEIESRIRELGLTGHVHCPGIRSDVPRVLRAADAFVLASLWEGFPNVVLEAMAASLPVVATRTGGVPELVEPPYSGFIVEPGDSEELAVAMSAMMGLNEAGRVRMGAYARRIVEDRFTLERTIQQTEGLYRSLLDRKGVNVSYEGTQPG